jgi:CheY-like chemotaxis protein
MTQDKPALLIIEDNPAGARLIREMLKEAGYERV